MKRTSADRGEASVRRGPLIVFLATAVAGALVAAALVLFWQPRWLLNRLPGAGRVVYFVRTDAPAVALTIDDAPDPETTPGILRVLAANDARATFFIITDRVQGNEELVRRMVHEGHELANHLTEDRPSIRLAPAEFAAAVAEADSILTRFGEVRWLRPAGGWYNTRMLDVIERHGYRCVLGSIYPYDPVIPSVAFATAHILRNARAGAIIVLHDGGGRGRRTARVLERVLPELRRRGIRVMSLSALQGVP